MNYGFGPANSQSAFLQEEFFVPKDYEQARDLINTREDRTANCLNVREIGQYEQVELINGQTWFSTSQSKYGQSQPSRYAYRRTFDLVDLFDAPIPIGATTIRVSPKISSLVLCTRCFGSATMDGPIYVFFPSPLVDITLDNSDPNKQSITITNNTAGAFTQCYVTIEYLKQS